MGRVSWGYRDVRVSLGGQCRTTRVPLGSWTTVRPKIKAKPWGKLGTIQSGGKTDKGEARSHMLWEERSDGRNQAQNLHQME